MDRDDREHFRTIAGASGLQPNECKTTSPKEPSSLRHDPASCLDRAKAIFGCYRRDEAHDPERFVAALTVVLGDYPASIVDYAADPRTGVATKYPMGLPSVPQIKQFLDEAQARQAMLARYSSLPKLVRVTPETAPKAEPNLFVPDTSNRYAAMLKQHEAHNGERSHLGAKTCADGVRRAGIFVPLDWWEAPQGMAANGLANAARKYFEKVCVEAGVDPQRGFSPALQETLREQEVENAASASVI